MALEIACQNIILGHTNAALIVGAESMSNVPYMMMNARRGFKMGPVRVEDGLQYDALIDVFSGESIMRTAENVAEIYHVTRDEQDDYAYISQNRAAEAIREGKFKEEIVPIEIHTKK